MAEARRHCPRSIPGIFAALLPLVTLAALGACAGDAPATEQNELPPLPAGAVRGELVVYTATYDDGTSDEQYFLRLGETASSERRLLFDEEPAASLIAGTK